jgi:hypothetical protein
MVLLKLWGYSGSRKLRSRYRASFGEYPWSNKANAWHLRLPGSRLYLRATTTSCLSLTGFMETFYEMLMEMAAGTIMETLSETQIATCSDCVSLDRTPCCSPAAVLNVPSFRSTQSNPQGRPIQLLKEIGDLLELKLLKLSE